MIPDPATRRALHESLVRATAAAVERVRGVAHGNPASAMGLCEAAGSEMTRFAEQVLAVLVNLTADRLDGAAAAWARNEYHLAVGGLGAALRDAVATSEQRHAVAQTLQRTVLEAELQAWSALELEGSAASAGSASREGEAANPRT